VWSGAWRWRGEEVGMRVGVRRGGGEGRKMANAGGVSYRSTRSSMKCSSPERLRRRVSRLS